MDNLVDAFVKNFDGLLYEAMPFVVLGAVIAGFLEEFVPRELVARIMPRSRILAIAIGGLLGLPFPMCECGIIPVIRRLLRKGVPLSACVSYLLAGPIINPIVMLSTWWAFSVYDQQPENARSAFHQLGSWPMVGMRMGLGYLVAFGTSLVVEWQHRKWGNKLLTPLATPPPDAKPGDDSDAKLKSTSHKPFHQHLANVAETALHNFVDVAVFLIIGAALASLGRLLLPHEQIEAVVQQYPKMLMGIITVSVMMGLAILLCICSDADAFVAASFIKLPVASKLAFLVLGPMLDIKLYLMYRRVFRPRLVWTIILCVVVQVFVYSLLVHFLIEDLPKIWNT